MKISVEVTIYPGRNSETVEISENEIRELAEKKFTDGNFCNSCQAGKITYTTEG